MFCLHSKRLLRGSYNFFFLLFFAFYANPWKGHIKMPHQKKHAIGGAFVSTVTCLPATITQNMPRSVPVSLQHVWMTISPWQQNKVTLDRLVKLLWTQVPPLRGSWLAQIILHKFVVFYGNSKGTCKQLTLTRSARGLEWIILMLFAAFPNLFVVNHFQTSVVTVILKKKSTLSCLLFLLSKGTDTAFACTFIREAYVGVFFPAILILLGGNK